jgi:acyl-coenzyme A thioesterase PaaI-like protein
MAAATTTILDDDESQKSAITTIDIFARFIRPVNAQKVEGLRAEARVIRAGGRLVWAEADVLADGDVVGKFASTGTRVAFVYAGFPNAWNALATMKQSLEGFSENRRRRRR